MFRSPLASFFAAAVGFLLFCFLVPQRFQAEREGVPDNGVIVRFESGASWRRSYPVVQTDTGQYRSLVAWRWHYYSVEDHVPILKLDDHRALIGPPVFRWLDIVGLAAAIVGCSWYGLRRMDRAARSAPTSVPDDLTAKEKSSGSELT